MNPFVAFEWSEPWQAGRVQVTLLNARGRLFSHRISEKRARLWRETLSQRWSGGGKWTPNDEARFSFWEIDGWVPSNQIRGS